MELTLFYHLTPMSDVSNIYLLLYAHANPQLGRDARKSVLAASFLEGKYNTSIRYQQNFNFLVPVAKQAGLSLTWSQAPTTYFSAWRSN